MTVSWNGEHAPIPPGGSYGSARVSTADQDLELQYEAFERAECRVIRAEKVSGTSTEFPPFRGHLSAFIGRSSHAENEEPVSCKP